MGYKTLSIKLHTDYTEEELKKKISKQLRIKDFSYTIEKKSLDARRKDAIRWQIRIGVSSAGIKGGEPVAHPAIDIPYKKRDKNVVVVGSGPAGFFSALVLQKAGFNVTLIERGSEVEKRAESIKTFESSGSFDPINNYAFGEGGAGTFSDGKLTSRSKHIAKEKAFILDRYISSGAPEEIRYMSHPHLGSDNLRKIAVKLREEFSSLGGETLFETLLEDIIVEGGAVKAALTQKGEFQVDHLIIAPGHSAYETYRMLISRGVKFRTKNFAIGSRVEHPQELINKAQWGTESLPGVKAAEYRLSSNTDGNFPVYTFCMCPGGMVVPAGAYSDVNVVNGMSNYSRGGKFANAACVAGIDLAKVLSKEVSALEALDWVEELERKFFKFSEGFRAPFCSIMDFVNKTVPSSASETSYPLGLEPAPLWELFPEKIANSITEGLKDISRKLKGFETGNIMGLESKTSAPICALREDSGLCEGFSNLYIAGEGSGYSGGIISSAADGVKVAEQILSV